MPRFDLPQPVDRIDLRMRDGAPITVVRHGNVAGRRLVLSHGNGFAIDGYYPFWKVALARYEIVLFDLRNHGRNPPAAGCDHGYPSFMADFAEVHDAVAARWGARTTVGVFHSMSALSALRMALDGRWHWDALVLFDPPVMPPPGHRAFEAMDLEGREISRIAAGRADRFADPADLARLYARRFPDWVPGAAGLVARAVLRRDEAAGDWRLACPKALESRMYLANRTLDMWPRAADFARPTILVGADPRADRAEAVAKSCAALHRDGGMRYATVPGTGHFLQLERPEECWRIVEDFLIDTQVAG